MRNDSKERYGAVTRLLHWGIALLIGWQLLKIFDRVDDGEHWIGQTLVPWHVSIGTLVLLLVLLRMAWARRQRDNRPEHEPATAFAVKAGHALLYVGMLLMPVTGILTMVGNGYGLTAFGMQLLAKGDEIPWMASVGSLHSPIAWGLLVLIAGHAGIAVLHHFVRKDGVLQRML